MPIRPTGRGFGGTSKPGSEVFGMVPNPEPKVLLPGKEKYLRTLKERAEQSKVYRQFQLEGLEIAKILQDERHKALYIKLAKEHDPQVLRGLALDVAERSAVKNKGAYFMALLRKRAADTR